MEKVNSLQSNTKTAIGAIILATAGLLFLLTTNPQTLAPLLLIVPFVLFFLSLFLAVTYVSSLLSKDRQPVARRKSLLFSILIAGYPVTLLLFQSVGQLVLRDVITVTLLFAVSALYVARSSLGA